MVKAIVTVDKAQNQVKVRTGLTRLSFPNLLTERTNPDTGAPNGYGCTLLFEKGSETDKAIQEAFAEARKLAVASLWGNKDVPDAKLKSTFGDGDDEDFDGYAGNNFVRCSSPKTKPGVVKKAPAGSATKTVPITDPEEIYAGCYVIATITVKGYNHPTGGKGLTAYINNVFFYKDGERFGGNASAESDFADLDFDDVPDAVLGSDDDDMFD